MAEGGTVSLTPDVAGRNMQEEFGEAIIGNNGQREMAPLPRLAFTAPKGEFLEAIGAPSAHILGRAWITARIILSHLHVVSTFATADCSVG